MASKKVSNTIVLTILVSLILAILFDAILIYLRHTDLFYPLNTLSSVVMVVKQVKISHILVFFILIFIAMRLLQLHGQKIASAVFKYRYAVAILVLAVCVIFELSGSSIALWRNNIPVESSQDGLLLGMPRPIRSDEWFVTTPFILSQFSDQSNLLPYFSDVLRGASTDTYLISALPVNDIAILLRPFYWGFLLLGPIKGLSFFWCARIIALCLVSFEMGRVLTDDKKVLSLIMALLLTFAPPIQWWFIAGGLVELLIFGQIAILLVIRYLKSQSYKIRVLLAIAIALSLGAFLFTMYPAWEIPAAFVFVAILIWAIISNRKKCMWKAKLDLPIIGGVLLILVALTIYILTKSKETVHIIRNTVYPGSSLFKGGIGVNTLFQYPASFFTPFRDIGMGISNQCEMSRFIDFAPMGWIIAAIVLVKEKNRDLLLYLLLAVSAIFTIYIAFGFPQKLANILLLSFSSPNRLLVISGFLNILILIRALSIMKTKFYWWQALVLGSICALLVAWQSTLGSDYIVGDLVAFVVFILAINFTFILLYNTKKGKYLLLCSVLVIMIMAGAFVNPIQKGVGAIYENPLATSIKKIVDRDREALWICEGDNWILGNYPIMLGARTINSTNTYPILERWHKLDPERQYEWIYNRYAHISMKLQQQNDVSFELIAGDLMNISFDVGTLKTLGAKYLISTNTNLELFSNEDVKIKRIEEQTPYYYLYEIVYE